MKLFLRLSWICVFSGLAVQAADNALSLLTFDDLSAGPDGSWAHIQNGYGGLQWHNFGVLNGMNRPVTEGYRRGAVSPDNVAFILHGDPASISRSSPFDLNSAYLTAAFMPELEVAVQGWNGTTLVYNNTYTLSKTTPTLIDFNYVGVDQVKFIPFVHSSFLALDNLVVAVPEPSTGALLLLGLTLGAFGFLKKKGKRDETP